MATLKKFCACSVCSQLSWPTVGSICRWGNIQVQRTNCTWLIFFSEVGCLKFLNNICVVSHCTCTCTCIVATVRGRGQRTRGAAYLCEFQGSNSGHQAWWQMCLLTEPSYWPCDLSVLCVSVTVKLQLGLLLCFRFGKEVDENVGPVGSKEINWQLFWNIFSHLN